MFFGLPHMHLPLARRTAAAMPPAPEPSLVKAKARLGGSAPEEALRARGRPGQGMPWGSAWTDRHGPTHAIYIYIEIDIIFINMIYII